jgi:hypothetical protein
MTIKNVAEDKGEIYDVGHHEADMILIPEGLRASTLCKKNVLTCSHIVPSATQLLSLVYHLV